MSKYPDPPYCQCGRQITETNKAQQKMVDQHVIETQETISEIITACNGCLKMPPSV